MKTKLLRIGMIFLLVSFYACAGASGTRESIEGKHKPDVAEEVSTIPDAPTGLGLMIVPNGFQLRWKLSPQDPGVVTGYEIVRSANIFSGPYITVATVNNGVSQYTDTTTEPENIYYYKVRAVAGDVFSPYSNIVAGER